MGYVYTTNLKHSAKGTTWNKKDHKYISKIVREGKTLYIYDNKGDLTVDNLNKANGYDPVNRHIDEYYDAKLKKYISNGDSEKFYKTLNDYKVFSNFVQRKTTAVDMPAYADLLSYDGNVTGGRKQEHKTVNGYIKAYNEEREKERESQRQREEEAKKKFGNNVRTSASSVNGKNGAPSSLNKVKHSDDSESLEHNGILGMKWGRRNGPPYPLGAADHSAAEKKSGKSGWTKEAQKEASKDTSSVKKESSTPKKEDDKNDKPKEAEKKSAKNMTDEELRAAVNRLQLETQYKNYLEQVTPKTVETGKSAVAKFAKKLGKDIAIKTITTAANSYATKLGNEIGTRGANATISKFTNKS